MVGEVGFGEVGCDDLANRVGVYEANVEDERDQVIVQDLWVEGEVDWNC